ncbi:MAG: hypothetical protein H0W40_14005 [Methylibium sp.]|uniref:hypothetical protein n=1 Tax=Methylibium sp. TaxID=2067992 RepID=UPI0017AB0307|nr:hypothetical protein [Methylibium sp.]MBA3598471.1 hypothetical protein [Methylibium sp.]
MDLHLPSHHWEHRLPDWPAAAVSGFVAGAALMVLDLLWSALVSGESPWRTSNLIAAIVLGQDTLASSAFSLGVVTAALVTHYALGVVFGLALAFILAGFHWDTSPSMTAVVGTLFGLVLYALNFHAMTQIFPWFAELRGWPTLAAHLLFGIVAALMYRQLKRRGEGH